MKKISGRKSGPKKQIAFFFSLLSSVIRCNINARGNLETEYKKADDLNKKMANIEINRIGV